MSTNKKSQYLCEFSEYQAARKMFWDAEIRRPASKVSRYYHSQLKRLYKSVIPPNSRVLELGCMEGNLLRALEPSYGLGIDFSSSAIEACDSAVDVIQSIRYRLSDVYELNDIDEKFDYVVISDLLNDIWDVQMLLELVQAHCSKKTRIVINIYSHAWNLPLGLFRRAGFARKNLRQNWLTREDVNNLLELSGFQAVKSWRDILIPIYIPFISHFLNRYLAKIPPFSYLDITNFIVARSIANEVSLSKSSLTTSVIIAARNESGHIEELIARIPSFGGGVEVIFIEGNSIDDTYEVIESCINKNSFSGISYKLLKQSGKGKGDAVRMGFEHASGDVLIILDADITVPPEELHRFFDPIASGEAEFVNGVRLVYPMEDDAMRFFNLLGNKFFSWAFTWLLGQPIRDTLCGTKALKKTDYELIARNRKYFGDFDPFGDFDLLFGAAKLNLKILEVPVRYRARRYGETNISRWKHGWLLLKMVAFAATRIKFI